MPSGRWRAQAGRLVSRLRGVVRTYGPRLAGHRGQGCRPGGLPLPGIGLGLRRMRPHRRWASARQLPSLVDRLRPASGAPHVGPRANGCGAHADGVGLPARRESMPDQSRKSATAGRNPAGPARRAVVCCAVDVWANPHASLRHAKYGRRNMDRAPRARRCHGHVNRLCDVLALCRASSPTRLWRRRDTAARAWPRQSLPRPRSMDGLFTTPATVPHVWTIGARVMVLNEGYD